MPASFAHFDLKLVSPSFDSNLTDILIELNHLRKMTLSGTTAPWTFFQLKEIFHLLESVGSARIEGNRTTVSEYIEQKIERKERSSSRFSEIANGERAMRYIEENIEEGSKITNHFIRELHSLAVDGLDPNEEGDKTPGAFRTWNVTISRSSHLPPEHYLVQGYMDELTEFINKADAEKYKLVKTAISHHRFTWIHPFGNGNGRVVRLLTYALLIKYGFNVKKGKLLNPTAVFCNDRDVYYEMLSNADSGDDSDILCWCEYVLKGILEEVSKVNLLTDHTYLSKHVLMPTINFGKDRGYLTKLEAEVLKKGVELQRFKATDINDCISELTPRQKTHLIAKLKSNNFIQPLKENGRTYYVNFMNNYLMRGIVRSLEKENFIPPIDK
jgi:Fic family protein